jgi:hypothetical protein
MFRRNFFAARAAFLVAIGELSALAQESSESPPAPAAESPPAPATEGTAENDPRVQEARESFRLGSELAHAGRWDEARTAFERSSELKSHPVTTYNIAFCNRAVGRLDWALRLFQQALEEHANGNFGKMPDALVALAQQYLAEVAARVARVTLSLDAGTLVLVDGHPLEAFHFRGQDLYLVGEQPETAGAAINTPNPVVLLSPGTHVFIAKRAGYESTVETRTLAAGQEIVVPLELVPPRPSASARQTPAPTTESPTSGANALAWIVGGAGVAALGTGAAFGVASLVSYDNADSDCPAHVACGQSAIEARDRAETYAWVSNIGLGVGVVGIAFGAYLLFTAPSTREHPHANRPQLIVAAGPELSFVGVRVNAFPTGAW